jgi:hypothetical protein
MPPTIALQNGGDFDDTCRHVITPPTVSGLSAYKESPSEIRISKARDFLHMTASSLAAMASVKGFADQNLFCLVLKRAVRTTPSARLRDRQPESADAMRVQQITEDGNGGRSVAPPWL